MRLVIRTLLAHSPPTPCTHAAIHRPIARTTASPSSLAPPRPCHRHPRALPQGASPQRSQRPQGRATSQLTRDNFFFWLPLHWTAPITGISGASLLKPSPPNPLVGLQQKPSKESELEPSQMRPKCAYSRFPGCLLENPMDKTPINWSIKFYWLQFTTYLRYDPER
jgi:hypothetical protein